MNCLICNKELIKGTPAIKIEMVLEPKYQYACLEHFISNENVSETKENVIVFLNGIKKR